MRKYEPAFLTSNDATSHIDTRVKDTRVHQVAAPCTRPAPACTVMCQLCAASRAAPGPAVPSVCAAARFAWLTAHVHVYARLLVAGLDPKVADAVMP